MKKWLLALVFLLGSFDVFADDLEDQISETLLNSLFPEHPFQLDGNWNFIAPQEYDIMNRADMNINYRRDFVIWNFEFDSTGSVTFIADQTEMVGKWEWGWTGHRFYIYFDDTPIFFRFMYMPFCEYTGDEPSNLWSSIQFAWNQGILEYQLVNLLSEQMLGNDSAELQKEIDQIERQLLPHNPNTFFAILTFIEKPDEELVELSMVFGLLTRRGLE